MKPEKQQLFDDLIDSENRRENTLLASKKILRRRRIWRSGRPVFALIIIAVFSMATMWLTEQKNQPPRAQISTPGTKPSAPPPVKFLTDEELLALFPNTPVGLITLHNGKKILYFPRASDRAKFIARF